MKFRLIYACFAMALGLVLLLGNSGGRASSNNRGNTGAPGDETLGNGQPRTCITCHNSGNIQVSISLSIEDETGAEVSAYVPNQTYNVTVRVNHDGGDAPNAYGFQMVALLDSDDSDVNGWSNPSANAQVATANTTSRSYAEQDGASDSNTFTVEWTAPPANSGNVTFYSCGNGVNGTGTSGGDGAACTTLQLTEDIDNSIEELPTIGRLNVFPTHTSDILTVSLDDAKIKAGTMRIINLKGQEIWTAPFARTANFQETIDVSPFATGIYFLQLQTKEGVLSRQFVKQ